MIYTLVLSAGLLFGPHCEDGCKVLTGVDTPPAGKYSAAQMFGYKGIGFHADGVGKIFAIHPTWTTERERILVEGEARHRRNVTAGCINISDADFRKLPRTRFELIIKE